MASSRLPLFLCSIVLQLVAHTIAQQDTPLDELCLSEMGTLPKRVNTRQTSIAYSPPSLLTLKLAMGSTLPPTAETTIKLMQWHFAEEMLFPTVAVAALKLLLWSSGNIVPTRKRLLSGTIIVC